MKALKVNELNRNFFFSVKFTSYYTMYFIFTLRHAHENGLPIILSGIAGTVARFHNFR